MERLSVAASATTAVHVSKAAELTGLQLYLDTPESTACLDTADLADIQGCCCLLGWASDTIITSLCVWSPFICRPVCCCCCCCCSATSMFWVLARVPVRSSGTANQFLAIRAGEKPSPPFFVLNLQAPSPTLLTFQKDRKMFHRLTPTLVCVLLPEISSKLWWYGVRSFEVPYSFPAAGERSTLEGRRVGASSVRPSRRPTTYPSSAP